MEGSDVSDPGMGRMWKLNQRIDQSMDDEAGRVLGIETRKEIPFRVLLRFAFQSLGIVYGDLATSPLYVFHSTFSGGIEGDGDLLGVLSLIIYTLTLIPLIKYTFIVMRANDNGEGGTFALYSLICRYANINTIPNQHPTDQELTTYSRQTLEQSSLAGKTKEWLEAKDYRQNLLVIFVLIGTCMVIGDGILTPSISVLSSVGGIKVIYPSISNDWVVGIAIGILVGLFSLQRFGTNKVGWLFAPAVFVWLLFIGCIGVYNIVKHDLSVFRAFSPHYAIHYLLNRKRDGWASLGGVMLCITGTEALYADVGHFSPLSVQIAFTFLVFPCLLSTYMGQAAFLMKYPEKVDGAFYKSTPESVFWPIFVVGTVASIIASQATISATFSIIKQSVALGCFPRVKIVHTSPKFSGQIYIPEINWILMVLSIAITASFRRTTQIGNAYGIAVIIVMLVSTVLMTIVMLLVWRTNAILVMLFAAIFISVELTYFSSMLFKVDQGGWVPLAIAFVFLIVMYAWHYGTLKRDQFEKQNKVSMGWILGLGPSLGLVRVPGIGLVYTELTHGVPSIFSHFITHLPAIHSVVLFVCIKYLPVNTVPQEERFLIRRIGPKDFCMYRCVVRYGYKDLHKRDEKFEDNLIKHLAHYIEEISLMENYSQSDEDSPLSVPQMRPGSFGSPSNDFPQTILHNTELEAESTLELSNCSLTNEESVELVSPHNWRGTHVRFSSPIINRELQEDLQFLFEAQKLGIVHIMGDVIVRAKRESNLLKKFAVDYIYAFLRRICRENSAILNIPHESLFNVGQVYYI